jgi:RHS repeat-associated protein
LPWDGGGEIYYYDYENRLRATSLGCNYTYSPTGERISTKCGGMTNSYGYDYGTGMASSVIAIYDATGARLDRVTYSGGVDTPTEQYASGTHYAYERDALGSVKRVTDPNGNTVNTYTYDVWGNPSQTGSLSNPFQFAAREWDSTNALYYDRARFYDPSSNGGHRFLGRDSMGGYTFAGDSPASFVDPATTMWTYFNGASEPLSGFTSPNKATSYQVVTFRPWVRPSPRVCLADYPESSADIGSAYFSYNTIVEGGLRLDYREMVAEWDAEIAAGAATGAAPHWANCGGGGHAYDFAT